MIYSPRRSRRGSHIFAYFSLIFVLACRAPGHHEGASHEAVTDVVESSVLRQSIGNCWVYATASWAESLNEASTGTELRMSESYWTYFNWFDQIVNDGVGSISTGGTFYTAAELIAHYGLMAAGDFIPEEATVEISDRQKSALDAINASLSSGALSWPEARVDRATVRAELDAAWALRAETVTAMDAVFGRGVWWTLDGSATARGPVKSAAGTPIAVANPAHHTIWRATLADAIGTDAGDGETRNGALAWNRFAYPDDPTERRAFQKRFQRALADRVPVILVWHVDFNALDDQGRFLAPPETPGRQGGHMVVMKDYQVTGVPGFGTLPVGILEKRPQALAAALDDNATIEFIRVKNSWGSERTDRTFVVPGYHDLYMAYLDGPVTECAVDDDDNPDLNNCWSATPFEAVVLPPGY